MLNYTCLDFGVGFWRLNCDESDDNSLKFHKKDAQKLSSNQNVSKNEPVINVRKQRYKPALESDMSMSEVNVTNDGSQRQCLTSAFNVRKRG